MRKLLLRATTLGCTSFYYGCATGPSALIYLSLLSGNLGIPIEELENPSEQEKQFVYRQLQKAGVPNYHQLKVKVDFQRGYWVSSVMNVIAIHPYITETHLDTYFAKNRLHALLMKHKQAKEEQKDFLSWLFGPSEKELIEVKKKIKQHKAILQHEAAHLKNNDAARIITAIGIIPLITHVIARNVKMAFRKPTFVKQFLKIPGGIGLILCNCIILQTYKRHIETKADENIKEDLETFQAFNTFLQNHQTNLGDIMQDWSSVKKRLFHLFLNDHPKPVERIKRVEERIKKLEKKII